MSPRSRRRGKGSNAPRRGPRNQGRNRDQRKDPAAFWGDPEKLPPVRSDIRIAEDGAAVVRSLGPPPLTNQEIIAEHYFSAVYDRATMLAGALATAAGLLTPEELEEAVD
jgi:hypothetical protein